MRKYYVKLMFELTRRKANKPRATQCLHFQRDMKVFDLFLEIGDEIGEISM